MTDINYTITSQAYSDMKKFASVGIAGREFSSKEEAAGYTYTTRDGELFSTPLIFPENPYGTLIKDSKSILDLGCGIGRNLNWIMENTNAHYIGLDPNNSMLSYFWDIQDKKYQPRVGLTNNFDALGLYTKFDVIVSTFVFQHIGYRTSTDVMNIADITKKLFNYCHENTVWILFEHQGEEIWIDKWREDTKIDVKVYLPSFKGIEELTHRDNTSSAGHDLIICKGNGQ